MARVDLISITEGLSSQLKGCTPEDIIAYTARVSNPNNQTNLDTAPNLVKYLIKHKHWSPFEMVDMTVQIKTTRAIAAQILRHRSFVFQEFSQRYAKAQDIEYVQARRQDTKNRQNSLDDIHEETKNWFLEKQEEHYKKSIDLYEEALLRGIAKEQARFLLPLATSTTMYMKGSVRSWIHYIELRTGNGTQKEHKDIADEVKEIFVRQFPNVSAALNWS